MYFFGGCCELSAPDGLGMSRCRRPGELEGPTAAASVESASREASMECFRGVWCTSFTSLLL